MTVSIGISSVMEHNGIWRIRYYLQDDTTKYLLHIDSESLEGAIARYRKMERHEQEVLVELIKGLRAGVDEKVMANKFEETEHPRVVGTRQAMQIILLVVAIGLIVEEIL